MSNCVTNHSFDRKIRPGQCKVYVDNKTLAATQAEKWFDQNKLYGLSFKSRAWTTLSRRVIHEPAIRVIRQLLNLSTALVSIKFSSKAGCSCGCSPGYVVKSGSSLLALGEYDRQDVWVTIENDGQADKPVIDELANATIKLKQEIEKHRA